PDASHPPQPTLVHVTLAAPCRRWRPLRPRHPSPATAHPPTPRKPRRPTPPETPTTAPHPPPPARNAPTHTSAHPHPMPSGHISPRGIPAALDPARADSLGMSFAEANGWVSGDWTGTSGAVRLRDGGDGARPPARRGVGRHRQAGAVPAVLLRPRHHHPPAEQRRRPALRDLGGVLRRASSGIPRPAGRQPAP